VTRASLSCSQYFFAGYDSLQIWKPGKTRMPKNPDPRGLSPIGFFLWLRDDIRYGAFGRHHAAYGIRAFPLTDWAPMEASCRRLTRPHGIRLRSLQTNSPICIAPPRHDVVRRVQGTYFWEWLHRFWDRLIVLVFAFAAGMVLVARKNR